MMKFVMVAAFLSGYAFAGEARLKIDTSKGAKEIGFCSVTHKRVCIKDNLPPGTGVFHPDQCSSHSAYWDDSRREEVCR